MSTTSRRRALEIMCAGVLTGLSGCNQEAGPAADGSTSPERSASPTPDTEGPAAPDGSVGLEGLAGGLDLPIDIAFVPGNDRRYIAEQAGLVYVHESDGYRDRPLLDLRDTIEFGYEKGLLGLALHPDFEENRRLFVRYSASRRPGTPSNYSHTFVLAEFEVTLDGRRVKRDSERAVLEIPQPQSTHNAGSIVFGPDDHLYVTVGDGGGGGDLGIGHADDWYAAVDGGNGQDVTENLLGSILRIDVDSRENGRAYAVPGDNPLVGRPGLDEYYAWGFRNPWRTSFDGTDFFVGDVGQMHYEEVNLVENGGNYGWNVKEGTHCYWVDQCPDEAPPNVRGGEPLVDPIIEYPHSGAAVTGNAVIGGYVYRGSAVPALQETYVFGDFWANGQLFAAAWPDDGGLWPVDVVQVVDGDSDVLQYLFSFGRDGDGELYVLCTRGDGGGVYRVVPAG